MSITQILDTYTNSNELKMFNAQENDMNFVS
jgi:hypothetical protein